MIEIVSTSRAEDLGLMALDRLSRAAAGSGYRVVGGHMVRLLAARYPFAPYSPRATADADAGIDLEIAADDTIHESLKFEGFHPTAGNHYEARLPGSGDEKLEVDLLVPKMTGGRLETVEVAGRGFDAISGLGLALAADSLEIEVSAQLVDGSSIAFRVPLPPVEAAVVLKASAYVDRSAAKDVADLETLFEIVHAHREEIEWRLDTPCKGARGDAIENLSRLVKALDRSGGSLGARDATRLSALVRRYVAVK